MTKSLRFVLPIVAWLAVASLALVPGIDGLVAVAAGAGAALSLVLVLHVAPLLLRRPARGKTRVSTLVLPVEPSPAPAPPISPATPASPPVLVTQMVSITASDAPRPTRARPRPKRTLVGIGAELLELARGASDEPPPAPSPRRSRSARDAAPLDLYPAPASWQPDLSLVPAKRRALADQLLARAITRCFVVGIFGSAETAGRKARVAGELALALAASGEPRTLLLDANLQHPTLHHLFRVSMPAACGFSQQLSARIRGGRRQTWGVVACRTNLHVLVEGLMLSPGVVLSTHFEACVRELRAHYDLIVIDGPFASERSDCRAVEAVIDGVLRLEGAQSSPFASPELVARS